MDMSKYLNLFISETTEHLQSLNENLSVLEKESRNTDALNACFRNAHSIKGMAASMSFEPIRNLAHSMEDMLDDFRQKGKELVPEALDLLFEGLDMLEKMVQEVAEQKKFSLDPEPLRDRINSFREGEHIEKKSEEEILQAHPSPGPSHPSQEPSVYPPDQSKDQKAPNITLRLVLDRETPAPGARGFLIFKRIQELGELISSTPALDDIKAGKFLDDINGFAIEVNLCTQLPQAEIASTLNTLSELHSYEIRRYKAAKLEPAAQASEEQKEETVSPQAMADPFATPSLPQTVRVKTQALDGFINILGEMILIKSGLKETSKRNMIPALDEGLDKLDRIVKDFHDQVMEIRLMPLEAVTMRLPGSVRDLARDDKKKVRFEIVGKDIELDRAILEQLSDPLLHLLRNCVSHGIEPPEERERLGKDPVGSIVLEAYRQRDMVLIEVRDDGRGMDPFQIKETALAKGLISQEDAETMTDEDVYQLTFMPGFSTTRQVGMVSGRGVGMDVVKTTVEGLGGFVSLSSVISKGTSIILHLPRTIAIVNVLLIRLAQEIFAIPITKILKTVEILAHQVRKSQKQQYYLDRQELVPLLELHRFLDMNPPENDRFPLPALLLEVQKRKLALVVDELIGQEEAFIRPLGKPLERISGLAGVTMLGDGRIVFVLDTLGLI
jgi:two-component system chemotaxis sensor kinase CheA